MTVANLYYVIGALGVIAVSIWRSKSIDDHKKYGAWKTFVNLHGLTMSSAGLWKPETWAYGDYKGHYLELDTFRGATRITLRVKNVQNNNKPELRNVTGLLNTSVWFGNYRFEAKPGGKEILAMANGLANNVEQLENTANLLYAFLNDYPRVVAMGSQAIPVLQEFANDIRHPLHPLATQLLLDIAKAINRPFNFYHRPQQVLCSDCLVRFSFRKIFLPAQTITYCGCRKCGYHQGIDASGEVIAVLDEQMTSKTVRQNRTLRANWLLHRAPFDFNRVEIINAGDEDVERFAVQVGNDTDPERKGRYKTMPCALASDCRLSENTLRILEMTFGEITSC